MAKKKCVHAWTKASSLYPIAHCPLCKTYRTTYYLGSRPYQKSLGNLKLLEQAIVKAKHDWDSGKINGAKLEKRTFEQGVEHYKQTYLIPNEQLDDLYQLPYFIDFFGASTQMASIDQEACKKVYAKLVSDYALSTAIRRFSLLRSIFRENKKVVPTNPCLGVVPKKAHKKAHKPRQRWFNDSEMQQIYRQCGQDEEAVLFAMVARHTGFRDANLEYMVWPNVLFDEGKVWARETKNGDDYWVPMGGGLRRALVRLGELRGGVKTGRVFKGRNWGRYFRDRIFKPLGWYREGMTKQELPVLHTFRHSFISRLVQTGVKPIAVKELAGWRGLSEYETYAHLEPNDLERAAAAIDCPPELEVIGDARRGDGEREAGGEGA